jgi:hypothetical protein
MTNEPSRELETLRQVSERLETERAEFEAASKQLVEARRRKIALESLGPGLYYRRAKSAQWQNTKELWRILLPMLRAALALKLRGRKPDPNLLSSFYDRSTEIEVEMYFKDCEMMILTAEQRGLHVAPDWVDSGAGGLLTPEGRVLLKRAIRADRRNNLEWWIKMITPILAAATGLLGVLIGLIAVLRK